LVKKVAIVALELGVGYLVFSILYVVSVVFLWIGSVLS